MSLCYPLMWNVTLEYTATHFNVLGETRPTDLPHTPANAQLDAVIVVNSRKLSRKYRTNRVLNPGPVVCESSTLSARPQRLPTCWFVQIRLKHNNCIIYEKYIKDQHVTNSFVSTVIIMLLFPVILKSIAQ